MYNILISSLIAVLYISSAVLPSPEPYGFKENISFLSSEKLGDRYPGSESDSTVQQWVISKFSDFHIEECPEFGSYIQDFDLVEYSWFDAALELTKHDTVYHFIKGKDFNIAAKSAVDTLEAEYMFIGYGLDESLHHLMKDRAVIVYDRPVPDEFSGRIRRTTLEHISEAGAKAAICVLPANMRIYDTPAKGMPRATRDIMLVTIPLNSLKYFMDEQFISGYDPVDNYLNPWMAKSGSSIRIANKRFHNTIRTANIIGVKKGVNGKYIIIGAHHDHLRTDIETGAVYPGANDNASGVSMMLELAKEFGKIPTNHNILFVAFGGEEKGCLGSNYFTEHLPLDREDIALMVNLDIIGNMKNDTLYFKTYNNITLRPDNTDEHRIILKENDAGLSDHFPFVKMGIPTLFFHTGFDNGIIHTPEDREERINYEGMIKTCRFLMSVLHDMDMGEPSLQSSCPLNF